MKILKCLLASLLFSATLQAQLPNYPKGYFRNPLNVPMQLVANFGELRTNHWHMGLDIRTQQRENLPVHAAAEGYIAKIKIEPFGFGRAIYINHPNGLTTLYAHLNDFAPTIEHWVKTQQYNQQSWEVELTPPPSLFPVGKGDFIAYSGNTGGSQGPHVHFEIRETATDKCLNPLLFGFPIADAVPPALTRLGMYDRNRSVYAQSPQLLGLRKTSTGKYALSKSNTLKVGSDRISFALGAVDFFTGSTNPNGVYSARILLDDVLQSEFILDSIDYDETRYMNAHIDYRYEALVGPYLQHLSRMPGDITGVYTPTPTEGVIQLADTSLHTVRVEVRDANQNLSTLSFGVQYDPRLTPTTTAFGEKWYPQEVNIFEASGFEVFSTERTLYDTVNVAYTANTAAYASSSAAVSPLHTFLHSSIPSHDSFTVRLKITEQLS
ncbi:MAG TPA: M23 family metallopeptidase, partial [Flavisolibacter sp.]|nr:M23 family metallopeptidase [Flavisolibacter sp.]